MSVESDGGHAQRGRDGGASPAGRAGAHAELTRLLEPAVTAAGYDLEEVDVRSAGRRRLVKVVVDADDGVDLDDIADVSRIASDLLDASDVMGSAPYVLEVTSPGVDRPLTEERHWRRAAGRLVQVRLADGDEVEGRVVAADGEGVELDVVTRAKAKGAKPRTDRRRYGHAELASGRVQVEFSRPGEPAAPGDEAAGEPAEPDETRSPAEPE
ncbi:ribosome maturation factor RimP [Actinomadura parmotrematis]|uniref:Ribosome maturation factor RimP n=1 Tax=Actinomadura parmotrematis TaxID=2864039 RepID=A0ABS7FTD4_9ACTN|nr:ribosome maturation factor RimP [Actinomadura parmotrematis]MBW8483663.1 ribosome maturation factor RimP [Actinomadura parmotrematis]